MKRKHLAFTIVELLVSLVIITILIGLLMPSIAMVRRKARETAQTAQITTIGSALETFKGDYHSYPPSNWPDPRPAIPNPQNIQYCGAQKLAEALLGWDLMGFHPLSAWRSDGLDIGGGNGTYDPGQFRGDATIAERVGRYLELSTVKAYRLGDLFAGTAPLRANTYVLCDVFGVRRKTLTSGKTVKMGTPILYYRADTSKTGITNPALDGRIYDYRHNMPLIALRSVTEAGSTAQNHPLGYDPGNQTYPVFYSDRYVYPGGTGYGIVDPLVTTTTRPWPCRPDSYILISAGADGLYGTRDDITNY